MWIREYIFNVLIQPFHLLLYTVLVGSAVTLVTTNMIYGIVAIGFLIPAEKLLRKFFGFDSAGTLSAAGSFAGGAVFSAMINKLNKPKPRSGKDSDGDNPRNRIIRKSSSNGINADAILIGGGSNSNVDTEGETKNSSGSTGAGGTTPEGGTREGDPISGGGTREGKPIPGEGTREGEPIPGGGTREGEPIPEGDTREGEPIPGGGTREGEPILGEGTREGEPIPGGGTREKEPIPGGGTREKEPIPGGGTREREPIPGEGTREGEPIPGGGTREGEPIPGGGTREGESIPGGGTREGESIPGRGTREREPIPGGSTREGGTTPGEDAGGGTPTLGQGNRSRTQTQGADDEYDDNEEDENSGYENNSKKDDWKEEQNYNVWATLGRRIKQNEALGLGDAFGTVGDRYIRKLKMAPKKAAKMAGRTFRRAAVGGIVGGALGITGLAVGVASGDPSKAAKYASAGAAAGYFGANYYGDKVAKEAGNAAKDASVGFWGEDYGKRQQYLFDKEFKRDPKNMRVLQKYLGKEEAKTAMKTQVQAFLNAGISDPKVIGKSLQLMKKHKKDFGKNNDARLQKAVSLAVWNRDSGKGIYVKNSRAYQAFRSQTIEQIQENSGLDEEQATNEVDKIIEYLEQIELARQ